MLSAMRSDAASARSRQALSEEQTEAINRTLLELQQGEVVTAVWYDGEGQEYLQLTGVVTAVDLVAHVLHISAHSIPFSELADLIPAVQTEREGSS